MILNELAQGLRPMAEGIGWFEGLADEDQRLVLRELDQFCRQARAGTDDASEAVRLAGLRPTYTPCVLVTRGPIEHQLGKVAALTPAHERIKAFRLLVHTLGLADARRRERFCAAGCGHEWHHLVARRPGGA
ncbi:DUF5958 family protein [Kitasatospora sp. NPDC097691]|uniref:DUF5958 family protein n=1 Tax=Kitasatospora sp. NPDC097691 TaxID=3157231 RepID=UPI00332DE282